jgi:hypothetical protein
MALRKGGTTELLDGLACYLTRPADKFREAGSSALVNTDDRGHYPTAATRYSQVPPQDRVPALPETKEF